MRYLWISLLLLSLLLAACGTAATPQPDNAGAEPTVESTATPALPPEHAGGTVTAQPTDESDVVVDVATLTPTPESSATPEPVNPDETSEPSADAQGVVREFPQVGAQVLSADPSPDGRFWVLKLLRETLPGGPNLVTLQVLDSESDTLWLASEEGNDLQHQHAWLPDGRLLWVDQGALWVSSGDGQTRLNLNAPEPMHEVWAGAEQMALVGGESAIWQLDTFSGEWTRVDEIVGNGPPVTFGGNLSISPDGTFAAFIFGGELWKVPLKVGEPAVHLATIEYPGRGGRINPPYPLADSPSWAVGEAASGFSETQSFGGVLLDSRDGRIVPVSEVYPGIVESYSPPVASPDGRWLAISQGPPNNEGTSNGYYIAPSEEIYLGQEIPGQALLGWSSEPAAVYLLRGSELVRVALPSGESTTLLSGLEPHPWPTFIAADDYLYVSYDFEAHAFTPDGLEVASLELPTLNANFLGATGRKVLFNLSSSDGAENVLMLWEQTAP
jgi:hypothetical protein